MSAISTLEDLAQYRERIMALAKQRKARRISVFGSIVRGELRDDSDIDFLVDFGADYNFGDHAGLIDDLGELLGRRVDVARRDLLREELAPNILAEETPLGAKTRKDLPPMKRDQRVYTNEILDRVRQIECNSKPGYEKFMLSTTHQDSIILCFEFIGGAIKRMDPALKRQRTEVDWSDLVRFGDALIQEYDRVDLDTVWDKVQNHLPALKKAVTEINRDL